jgi:hypothetical protein
MPLPLAAGVEAVAAVEVAAGEGLALVGLVGERIFARIAPTVLSTFAVGRRGPCPLLAVGRQFALPVVVVTPKPLVVEALRGD